MFYIKKLYKEYHKKTIISIENYHFNDNGLYLVKGPNGSGKSTLVKALLGLINYDGDIYFNNINIKNLKENIFNDIYYLSQDGTLYNNLNYKDNLRFYDDLNDTNTITTFNDNKLVKKHSSGEKVKLEINKVIDINKNTVILDEPTTSLDKYNKEKLIKYIKDNISTKLFIIITHDNCFDEIENTTLELSHSINNDYILEPREYKYSKKTQKISFENYFKIFIDKKFKFIFDTIITFLLLLSFLTLVILYNVDINKISSRINKELLNYTILNIDYETDVKPDYYFHPSYRASISIKKEDGNFNTSGSIAQNTFYANDSYDFEGYDLIISKELYSQLNNPKIIKIYNYNHTEEYITSNFKIIDTKYDEVKDILNRLDIELFKYIVLPLDLTTSNGNFISKEIQNELINANKVIEGNKIMPNMDSKDFIVGIKNDDKFIFTTILTVLTTIFFVIYLLTVITKYENTAYINKLYFNGASKIRVFKFKLTCVSIITIINFIISISLAFLISYLIVNHHVNEIVRYYNIRYFDLNASVIILSIFSILLISFMSTYRILTRKSNLK